MSVTSYILQLLRLILLATQVLPCRISSPDLRILLSNYDRGRTPKGDIGDVTHVGIGIHVTGIHLDSRTETVKLDVFLRQKWVDPRLVTSARAGNKAKRDRTLEPNAWDCLWTPNVFLRNALRVIEPSWPSPQRAVGLGSQGHVTFTQRLQITVLCPGMARAERRGDLFVCPVIFESFSYSVQDVNLTKLHNPVTLEPHLTLSDYRFLNFNIYDCSKNSTRDSVPCVEIDFTMRRTTLLASLFVSGVYLSSFLLVLLSWAGFWLEGSMMLERFGLGLVIAGILTVQSLGADLHVSAAPQASQRLHAWIAFCQTLVLASLLEFAFAHVMLKLVPRKIKLACQNGKPRRAETEEEGNNGTIDKVIRIIDVSCGLVVFPLIFLVYNIFYWYTYNL